MHQLTFSQDADSVADLLHLGEDVRGKQHRLAATPSLFPTQLLYKVVPTGLTIQDVSAHTVNVQAWNARPFPVREFSATRDADTFNIRFTFNHWTRRVLPVGTLGPFQLDESYEGYELRIYDPAGSAVRRVKRKRSQTNGSPTLRDRWFDYTATEQTQDGYTPSLFPSIWVEIVQRGDVGDGPAVKQQL